MPGFARAARLVGRLSCREMVPRRANLRHLRRSRRNQPPDRGTLAPGIFRQGTRLKLRSREATMTIRTDQASADQRLGTMLKRRAQQSHAGRKLPKPKVVKSPSSSAIKSAERAPGILAYFRQERRAATVG